MAIIAPDKDNRRFDIIAALVDHNANVNIPNKVCEKGLN